MPGVCSVSTPELRMKTWMAGTGPAITSFNRLLVSLGFRLPRLCHGPCRRLASRRSCDPRVARQSTFFHRRLWPARQFHQQAQRQNWAGAWNRLRAPVLVLHGEYDWFESRDAAQLIANIVNDRQPGSATFRELPQLDHHFTRYASRRDAFREKDGKENADPAVKTILEWLSQIGMRSRDARAPAPGAGSWAHR